MVDAHVHFSADPVVGLKTLLDTSEAVARRQSDNAQILGLVDATGHLSEIASLMRNASVVERREILRYYLESFPPYAEWKRRVAQGFDPLEAARLSKRIFDIDESAADIRDWFMDLGLYSGSIREEGTAILLVDAGTLTMGGLISGILNRVESATDVLTRYLGEPLWRKLPESSREHLTTGLTKLSNDEPPDEVVREAGMALDAYATDLGDSIVGGYGGLTLGQAAQKLKADGIIVGKQEGFTRYAADVRNAAEHPDSDAELPNDRWVISVQTAQTYLRLIMDFMRSVDAKVGGRYEL